MSKNKRIVIVGGGAGGLELIARLSRKKTAKNPVELILVDDKLKHVWKPLLHEVATGTLLSSEDEIDYLSYARGRFQYEYGAIKSVNRAQKTITVASVVDEHGVEILPEREIAYDILVLAIGSISNDFNIPGVKENCVYLDSLQQAEAVNKLLVQHIIKLLSESYHFNKKFNIAIIGGGATGVELAAEIHYAMHEVGKLKYAAHGRQFDICINVIESASRILPQLPERISTAAHDYLQKIGIGVKTDNMVVNVTPTGIETKSGEFIPADLMIWAAGVKVDSVVQRFDGLAINKINQIIVKETLQSITDENIFAFGDCASCPLPTSDGKQMFVPPRAQAAHQQAKLLAQSLWRYLADKPLFPYHYHDYGSLITISKYDSFGRLMSRVAKNLYIEGKLAHFTYWLLHKKHQAVLWGTWRVILMTCAEFIASKSRPKLKLH